jgi:anti-sigma B factor antagonist
MQIDQNSEGKTTILSFSGELDAANLDEVKEKVDGLIQSGHSQLVFDLEDLKFINSSGLGYFIKALKQTHELDGDLVLAKPSKFFQTTIKTLGIDQIFHIFGSPEEAVKHFASDDAVEEQEFEGQRDLSLLGSTDLHFKIIDGPDKTAVGKILSIYEDGPMFKYPADPDSMSIDPDDLQLGSKLSIRFRQPFLDQERFFEMDAEIVFAMDLEDEDATKFRLEYTKIDDKDRELLTQFVQDLDLFRSQAKPHDD